MKRIEHSHQHYDCWTSWWHWLWQQLSDDFKLKVPWAQAGTETSSSIIASLIIERIWEVSPSLTHLQSCLWWSQPDSIIWVTSDSTTMWRNTGPEMLSWRGLLLSPCENTTCCGQCSFYITCWCPWQVISSSSPPSVLVWCAMLVETVSSAFVSSDSSQTPQQHLQHHSDWVSINVVSVLSHVSSSISYWVTAQQHRFCRAEWNPWFKWSHHSLSS